MPRAGKEQVEIEREEFRGTSRYELRSRLGAGAMGVVYEAWDRDLEARVALKCLPSTSPEAFFRFKREFRSLQDLQHENLVKFQELVYQDPQLFFTMELVDGTDIISHCWQTFGPSDAPRVVLPASLPDDRTLDGELVDAPSSRVVRPRATFDESRVRNAFAQLVRGLMALHAASKVHRDVKPSNVLVTRQGRVVLLDFGVVAELAAGYEDNDGRLVGSIAYMAPEQAAKSSVGREADFYAVGVMLFEVLTQRLPFEGDSSEVLRRKQAERPPRARELWPDAPEALERLCTRLLEPNPDDRPKGDEILRMLESDLRPVALPARQPTLFVGRERELESMQRALVEAGLGNVRVVHIEGESGSGKTRLVRHFLDLARADGEPLVFRGRCSERELVPYKAIDGVVDELAEFVVRSPSAELMETIERCLPELVPAFPVFGRISARVERPPVPSSTRDPYVRRLALFRAFRDSFAAVCAERTVIVSLDDMQWADADSLAMLSALLNPPPRVRLLLLVAGRPASGKNLRRTWGGELLTLQNLSRPESTALARHLLDRSGHDSIGSRLAERIATEASGHPLFIDELVQQAIRDGGRLEAPAALDLALWSRVQRLDSSVRALVELSAVASSPLALRVLGNAAARTTEERSSVTLDLQTLRAEHLLRFDGTEASSRVEPYHDRIGAAVRDRLSEPERKRLHRAIATALEGESEKDPAELALHWSGSGEMQRASGYALLAAELAERTLAFDRAARLYQQALECWPDQSGIGAIREKMADALASAGLGMAASRAYLEASRDTDDLQRLDLERRAADQLFRAGHIDQAEPLIQRVLRHMGMSIPRSAFWSLVVLLISRVRLLFTRLDAPLPAEAVANTRQLAMLNACWSVAVGLSMVNNIRGASLQTRHLILAVRMGQRLPLLKALAAEASYAAVTGQGARKRVTRLLARADILAAALGDPYADGFTNLSKAICGFLMGEWERSRDFARDAEQVFVTRPAGAMWELASARTFGLWASFYLGDIGSMRARIDDFIQEAEARGDRYALTLHRTGLIAMVWLASDEPAAARQRVIDAETGWSRSTFDFQRYLNTLGHCLIDVYEGAPELAYRRITEIWSALSRSLYLRIQNVRFEALYLRGLSAVGAAARGPSRKALLADAERCAARIAREKVSWSSALSSILMGGVSEVRGDQESALAHLDDAERAARANGMSLFADAARYRSALIRGDTTSTGALEDLRKKFAREDIRDPDRLCSLLAPGLAPTRLKSREPA